VPTLEGARQGPAVWSTTAQRWSLGVLAAVVLLALGAAATGRDYAAIEAARFVDAAVDAPLTEGGPRSTTSFRNELGRTRVWESSCVLFLVAEITGRRVDSGIKVGDPTPAGVAEALTARGQNIAEFETRTWLSASKVALASFNDAHAPTPGDPDAIAYAAYVQLIYVQGFDHPAWVVQAAATAWPCPDGQPLYP
jgi:hypothetical protein